MSTELSKIYKCITPANGRVHAAVFALRTAPAARKKLPRKGA